MAGQGRLALDRAPRLRRLAVLIDAQAATSRSPKNARALACKIRLRASELEAGAEVTDDEETTRLLSEAFDEGSE